MLTKRLVRASFVDLTDSRHAKENNPAGGRQTARGKQSGDDADGNVGLTKLWRTEEVHRGCQPLIIT
jgi:hypothetical protein